MFRITKITAAARLATAAARRPLVLLPTANNAVQVIHNNSSRSSSSTAALLPKLPKPSPPPPLSPVPQKGFARRLWDRHSITQQQDRILIAESLFQAATVQSQDPRWYGPGRVGREFRPRHALLTMHIWFLHKRLISDNVDKNTALMVQEDLFNILWDDTTCRIRQQGVNELLINKNLQKVQKYTFSHLTNYDHVYTEFLDKPKERLDELRKLLQTHIFMRDKDAPVCFDHADRLAWYIDANYQNIMMDCPDEYYRKARIKWVDLPNFKDIVDNTGTRMADLPVHDEDSLPFPWRRNITLKGTEYYWNVETRESSYERPT